MQSDNVMMGVMGGWGTNILGFREVVVVVVVCRGQYPYPDVRPPPGPETVAALLDLLERLTFMLTGWTAGGRRVR